MKLPILSIVVLTLCSCYSDDDANVNERRDLSEALSLQDLIERRMANDNTLDGSTVLINDELNAYFDQSKGCAIDIMPCTEENYSNEISESSYQGTGVGPCSGYGLELTNNTASEEVIVNLDEHTQFFVLTEEKSVVANFYAEIEFVERQAWCSDQINYGIRITLTDGEEDYLINQFTD